MKKDPVPEKSFFKRNKKSLFKWGVTLGFASALTGFVLKDYKPAQKLKPQPQFHKYSSSEMLLLSDASKHEVQNGVHSQIKAMNLNVDNITIDPNAKREVYVAFLDDSYKEKTYVDLAKKSIEGLFEFIGSEKLTLPKIQIKIPKTVDDMKQRGITYLLEEIKQSTVVPFDVFYNGKPNGKYNLILSSGNAGSVESDFDLDKTETGFSFKNNSAITMFF